MSEPVRIDLSFEPSGKKVRVPSGVSVFDAASWNGLAIDSTCGGHGTCKKCRVQLLDGAQTPPSAADTRAFTPDEIDAGWRLACLAQATSDLRIQVPPLTTRPKAATLGVGRQVILRPAVVKRYVELSEPSLADQRPDATRVLDELTDVSSRIDRHALRDLPRTLRAADYKVTAVVVDEILIDVQPGDTTDRMYGVAFDLGTTTVVCTLLDIKTGTPMAVASMLNKQQPFGADVISRISATMLDQTALEKLQTLAQDTLRELVDEVCEESGVQHSDIYQAALAGNATMVQLALGIDPESIGVAPFILAADTYPDLMSSDFGLTLHPRAPMYCFPALGAYVGGDIIAGALATGMDRDNRLRLFIDIGTNCEIILGDGDRLLATAAPAGPAFEAASIRCGMRAAPGAIEVVTIDDEGVHVQVIDDVEPVGICGSGLVDAVAELVRIGLLDRSGKFIPEEDAKTSHPHLADRLQTVDKERIFVLHDDKERVVLTQRDVRELQFAKPAISTGWKLLLEEYGIEETDVQQVLLAGSFGTYLSARNAIRIGLVPKVAAARVISAGNVAGEGAKMAVLSGPERHGATTLINEISYVELSDRTDFNDRFVDELAFPGS